MQHASVAYSGFFMGEEMKKLVSELSGSDLDYWVARAEGFIKSEYKKKDVFIRKIPGEAITVIPVAVYTPSTNPAQGWPIIEREKIGLSFYERDNLWYAIVNYVDNVKAIGFKMKKGETGLIAAMRCRVALAYGEYIGNDNE